MTLTIIWKIITSRAGRWFALGAVVLTAFLAERAKYGRERANNAKVKLIEEIENVDEKRANKILDRVERGRADRVRDEPYGGPYRDD